MMKKLTAVTAAITFCMALTACGNNNTSKTAEGSLAFVTETETDETDFDDTSDAIEISDTETDSESDSDTEESLEESSEKTTKSTKSIKSTTATEKSSEISEISNETEKNAETQENSQVSEETFDATDAKTIGDLSKFGFTVTLPSKFSIILSTNIDDNFQPKKMPIADDSYTVAANSGDNFSIYVSKGQSYEDFDKLDEKTMKDQLAGAGYADFEFKSFEKTKLGDYPVMKIVYSASLAGQPMTFTRYYIDVYNKEAKAGYCYYLTLTDIPNDDSSNTDQADSIFKTMKIDADKLIAQYPDPKDLHDSQ